MDAEKRKFYDSTQVDDYEMRPEEFKEQFQEMMAELMGGESVMEMVAGMSGGIKMMPPFPFPKELFPPGTFPPALLVRGFGRSAAVDDARDGKETWKACLAR